MVFRCLLLFYSTFSAFLLLQVNLRNIKLSCWEITFTLLNGLLFVTNVIIVFCFSFAFCYKNLLMAQASVDPFKLYLLIFLYLFASVFQEKIPFVLYRWTKSSKTKKKKNIFIGFLLNAAPCCYFLLWWCNVQCQNSQPVFFFFLFYFILKYKQIQVKIYKVKTKNDKAVCI